MCLVYGKRGCDGMVLLTGFGGAAARSCRRQITYQHLAA